VLSIIINSSSLYVNIFSKPVKGESFILTDAIGLSIWLTGFIIEVDSDNRLKRHLAARTDTSPKFCRSGCWKYSRHPNYIGEIIMWWGLWVISFGVEHGWKTVYAPIVMTFCIRFITGVPFHEDKYKDHPEWKQVCNETNVFIPWFSGMKQDK